MTYTILSFVCCFSMVGLCVSAILWFKATKYCKKNNIDTKTIHHKNLSDHNFIWMKKVKNRKITFFVFLSIFVIFMIVVGSLISVNK